MERRRCGADTIQGAKCRVRVNEENERCWIHRSPPCAVCFSPMAHSSNCRTLECGHVFHDRCLERWKRTCTGPDPTCPMCRVPFDVPTYRCRLIIERVQDNEREAINFETPNVASIVEGFGIDFRSLVPESQGRFFTDIHFDIDPSEALSEILRELGLPQSQRFH